MSNACCEQTITLTTTSTEDVLAALAAAGSDVSVNGQRITNLGTPSADTDAATKAYVDAVGVGLRQFKSSVRAATTANITLSGAQTIDGVSVLAGDRVLVKSQSSGAQNGIYVCAAGAWSRATDADTSGEVTSGMYCFVDEGSTNADSGWVLATNNPIVLGTTDLTFTKFTSIGGDFVGPSSSTDNAIVRFDGTGGKTGQASGVTISDADLVEVPNTSGSGLLLHNTADKVTNKETGALAWSSNELVLSTDQAGSGTLRSLRLRGGPGGGSVLLSPFGSLNYIAAGSTVATPHTFLTAIMASTSAVQTSVSITSTVNQTSGSGGYVGLLINPTLTAVGSAGAKLIDAQTAGASRFSVSSGGTVSAVAGYNAQTGTAIPAGGAAGQGYKFFSTANFGVFGGSGAPTLSAAKGSLYLRSDGSGTNDRMYVNTDGSTTWTALVTVA